MKTILLIDDDEGMLHSYGLMLRKSGYRVLEATSGSMGFKTAQQFLPDLILSDINMPGGDGRTLLRDLRSDAELKSVQIVLMTGKPELATPRRVMEEGADDFLVKPVSMEALLACVAARFDRASVNWRVEDNTLDRIRSAVPVNLPHEFFTPMAGIIGLTEILRGGSAQMTSAEIDEIANDIHQSALRLNRTLKNYLQILEVQTSEPDPLVGSLLPRRVEECINLGVKEALQFNERQNDVTVLVKPCSLPVKAEDLSRIVEEIVDNACKFSRQGTAIRVQLGDDGELIVTDQGRGMTPEQINQIGAFQQFDRKRYEQQGLGLGLLLVQKLAQLHGAALDITSEPGKGTRAQITFPSNKLST
jgi:two-component system, sensor histidine kinase and response regulator